MINIPFKGLLFDLDGTLVDSIPAVIRSWSTWATMKDLDPSYVLSKIHGRPARESITELLKDATSDEVEQEFKWLERQESIDTEGTVALPGSIALLESLIEHNVPWAIVTSGTVPVATARIKAAKLPFPPILITPEKTTNGKPHPEPFLKGAEEIGVPIEQCICFEDTQAGLSSAKSAGAQAIGVLSHASKSELPNADHHINQHCQLTFTTPDEAGYVLKLPECT
ncbi:HAD-IA family hydrolase [Vibrio bivalvicida]|uniref:HAD-IA family hydrolase n=1 Tax=Vibrio bivalvicida TaxID=1276888 RepID=A0ABV4MJT3_9VIBR